MYTAPPQTVGRNDAAAGPLNERAGRPTPDLQSNGVLSSDFHHGAPLLPALEHTSRRRSRPMRIVLVSNRFWPSDGGVQRHVRSLARELTSRGHAVSVWTHHLSDESPEHERTRDGYDVIRFPLTFASTHAYTSLALRRAIQHVAADIDIMHVHGYHDTPMVWARPTEHTSLMITPHFHGTSDGAVRARLHGPYRRMMAPRLARASAIGCVSQTEARTFTEAFPNLSDRIVITSNGIDLPLDHVRSPRANAIVYVGRLDVYKNVDRIVHAMQAVPAQYRLEIVGDGPERDRLQALVRSLGLGHRVILRGRLSDAALEAILTRVKVMASCSSIEAQGISVLDALGRGINVVASDIPAHREISEQFGGVRLITPGSSTVELAAALSAAAQAPATCRPVPTWSQVADTVEQTYRTILNSNATNAATSNNPSRAPV